MHHFLKPTVVLVNNAAHAPVDVVNQARQQQLMLDLANLEYAGPGSAYRPFFRSLALSGRLAGGGKEAIIPSGV